MFNKIYQWLLNSLTNTLYLNDYLTPFARIFNSSWSRGYYIAKVKDIRIESDYIYTLVLKPSKNWKLFEAGQYIQLRVEINGSLLTRTFSISSSPLLLKDQGLIEVTIQKQEKGRVTPLLQDLLVKDQYISISEAKGEFTYTGKPNSFLFIAAGSGITPIKSLINEHILTANNKIQLQYYASNNNHLFKQELSYLENKYPNLTINFINTSIEGRINFKHLKLFDFDYFSRDIYICGPPAMIQATQNILNNESVNPKKIHYEYFGSTPIKELNIKNKGEVTFQQSSIKINTKDMITQTLLEIAESSGLSPNYGCRMGVCHQCVCKKNQGVIFNTLTKIFSDTGTQDIQLCICVPVGDVILDL